MPRPYSADLRERVLSAHEHGEDNAAAVARRFRVAVNTVKNWVRAAATEERHLIAAFVTRQPLGLGPRKTTIELAYSSPLVERVIA